MRNIEKPSLEESIRDLFSFDKKLLFVLLCLITLMLLIIKKSFIESGMAAFEILEERGEMGLFHLINAIQYLSVPFYYLWKFLLITFLIWVGGFTFGYKITFIKVWQIVMIAELIFVIPDLIKTFWFIFIVTDPNYWDVKAFYPLSLMNFFDYELISKKWHYPLKTLNLFEIIYWFILVYGIHLVAGKKKKYAFAIIFCSYVLFLFIWLGFHVITYE